MPTGYGRIEKTETILRPNIPTKHGLTKETKTISKKKSILKRALEGATETLSNYKSVLDSNKKSKDNIYLLAVDSAKKQYASDNNGADMTPSKLKDELMGGIISKATRQYIKNRDAKEKEYKNKFSIK
jgi:Ribonuclease G/E